MKNNLPPETTLWRQTGDCKEINYVQKLGVLAVNYFFDQRCSIKRSGLPRLFPPYPAPASIISK
jgi:hypothetical protein